MEPDPVALAKQLIDELNSGNPPQLLETWIACRLSELMEAYQGKSSQTGRTATMKEITKILIDLTRWRSMRSASHSLHQIVSAAGVMIARRYEEYKPAELSSDGIIESLTQLMMVAQNIQDLSLITLLRCSEEDTNTVLDDSEIEKADEFREIIKFLPTLESALGVAIPLEDIDTTSRVESHLRKIADLIEAQRELVSKFIVSIELDVKTGETSL